MKRAFVCLLVAVFLLTGVTGLMEDAITLEPIGPSSVEGTDGMPGDDFDLSLPDDLSLEPAVEPDIEAKATGNATYVTIDKKNFPSAAFRKVVKKQCDKNGDGKLSKSEIEAVTSLEVRSWADWSQGKNKITCANLKGIEFFGNLKSLTAVQCGLKKLDLSENTKLTELFVYDNKLSHLDLTKNRKLKNANLGLNPFTTLDLSKNTKLEGLGIENGKLESIDLRKNQNLKELYVPGNQLKKLDLSKNTKLKTLYCNGNRLKKLDLSKNKNLKRLCASENSIKTIDLKNCPKLRTLLKQKPTIDSGHAEWGKVEEDYGCRPLIIDVNTKLTSGSKVLYDQTEG